MTDSTVIAHDVFTWLAEFPWAIVAAIIVATIAIGLAVRFAARKSFEHRWRGPQYRRGHAD